MTPDLMIPLSVLEQAVLQMFRDSETGELEGGVKEESVQAVFWPLADTLKPTATPAEVEELFRHILTQLSADILGTSGAVVKKDHRPWLQEQKTAMSWKRWHTYRTYLSKEGRSAKILDRLDHFTDDVLDLVGDPKAPGPWSRRGLIIGDVQSGKTQNYIGLMNKAADAGYKLIIVLSGNTEYLRRQTQGRVDAGFIGRDTQLLGAPKTAAVPKDQHIGVGKIDKNVADVLSLTTVLMDYLQASKKGVSVPLPKEGSTPLVFVLKKNKHILESVEAWAASHAGVEGKLDLPLFLLDDESDYASVNTAEAEDPTAINSAIRRLLARFRRSSYLAITATPFANIFVDHEAEFIPDPKDGTAIPDLFPEDYIYPLQAPTNYVGIDATFGTVDDDSAAMGVIALDDADSWIPLKHKKEHRPGQLPSSLDEAIRSFMLANAILDLRVKKPKRRSMLINASRFTNVQDAIGEQVRDRLYRYQAAIEGHALTYVQGSPNQVLDEMKDTFNRQYGNLDVSWSSVLNVLHEAVSATRVKVYNSRVDDSGVDEAYEGGVPERQIAIGGDLLSRGLTLDGLMISYFHRSVGAADTMMQMARWFGYRDGYRDVCRLWISEKTATDYRFIGSAVRELRDDLEYMRRMGMTPRDFGLAVQQHPESLLITARNKSKSAIVAEKEINLLGRVLETTKLHANPEVQAENFNAIVALGERLGRASEAGEVALDKTQRDYQRFRNVPKRFVADLLEDVRTSELDIFFSGSALANMVRSSNGTKFESWDVIFVNGGKSNHSVSIPGLPAPIKVSKRTFGVRSIEDQKTKTVLEALLVSGNRSRLAGTDDLAKVLDENTERAARDQFVAAHNEYASKTALPERAFYASLDRPQLMVYLLEESESSTAPKVAEPKLGPEWQRSSAEGKTALVGLKVALPSSTMFSPNNRDGHAKYLINTVAQRYWQTELEGVE
ncbi:Z1 domain-containing protein [Arthrobacter cupressi]